MKHRQPALPLAWKLLTSGAVFLLGACGASDADMVAGEGSSRVEFLALEVAGHGQNKDLQPRVVARLTTEKPTQWQVTGANYRVVSARQSGDERPTTALKLSDPATRCSVGIKGPFDPQSFNLLALRFRAQSKWELGVDFMSKGKRVSFTPPMVITPESGAGTRLVAVEAPHLRRLEAPIDEIVIRVTGSRHGIWVVGLDLLWQGDHKFLPNPTAGGRPVLIGREMRNSVGISSAQAVSASVSATAHGILRFSYGTPGELARAGSSPRLQLVIRAEDGLEQVETYELDTNFRKARWRQAMVSLSAYAGQVVEAEWSVLAAGGEAVCAIGEVSLVEKSSLNRSVLLITSDTHRGDHLGLAGEGVDVDTPMLDALASRGVFFEDCFSATNITNPSHIAMMTGVHPRDTGIVNNYTRVADAAPTLAEAFRDAGYLTFASVSTKHLSDPTSGLGQGFERASYPMRDFARDGSETIEVLEDWLNESEGLPVFVWLHLFDAHMPYSKDVPGLGRYYGDKDDAFDERLPELGSAVQKAINNLRLPGLRDLELPRALYRAEITQLDERLGEFLQLPTMEGAVIAFTADHGESLGNHDIYFAHEELYRESLHVPLILSWPGGPQGRRFGQPVSNLDVGRTLLDLSGNLGTEFPGQNLALLIEEEESSETPRYSLSAHGREVSLTENGWHLQLRLGPNDLADGSSTREQHQVELYYLSDDPHCASDLLETEHERARAMRTRVIRWLEERKELNWIGGNSGDSDTLKDLEALGYTGGANSGEAASLAIDPECSCHWCAPFE